VVDEVLEDAHVGQVQGLVRQAVDVGHEVVAPHDAEDLGVLLVGRREARVEFFDKVGHGFAFLLGNDLSHQGKGIELHRHVVVEWCHRGCGEAALGS
jgi:hypothetical protein